MSPVEGAAIFLKAGACGEVVTKLGRLVYTSCDLKAGIAEFSAANAPPY